jgi:nitroimidazol reductase NimA-like FMN-containing flavoprotein (pyridoxamine 5'-phosphate oxidase superfamily)
MSASTYPVTAANRPTRGVDRATWDRDTVHAILDATPVCHLAYVDGDGSPITIPTTFARVGEALVLHSSSGAHLARRARANQGAVEVCVTATIVDGWVLARSGMHHSMNYRCVVVRGAARLVPDEAGKRAGLAAILDAVWADRSRHCRPPNTRELAASAVYHLPLEVVSAKVRAEGAVDDPDDVDSPYWAGVVPVVTTIGDPVPNGDLRPGIELPGA